jgi:hypothetical protein
MKCIVWLLDSGVEKLFSNSLGSLRINGRQFWNDNVKLVLDFGLTKRMRKFLSTLEAEGVYVQKISLPTRNDVVGGNLTGGIGVMRMRIKLTDILPQIISSLGFNIEGFIVCDSDTVFLKSPTCFPIPESPFEISIMKEWDNIDNVETNMKLYRQSSFSENVLPENQISIISSYLGLREDELRTLPTFNTGVFGFRCDSNFSSIWENEYGLLKSLFSADQKVIFSPFAAEQNALSLCIYKGLIQVSELPRKFNQFPPRYLPHCPEETVIAHFITFKRNHNQLRYKLFYTIRDQVHVSGFIPEDLLL